MDALAACFGLGLLAFAGIGALFGWIAYIRLKKLERRVAEFEAEHLAAEARRRNAAALAPVPMPVPPRPAPAEPAAPSPLVPDVAAFVEPRPESVRPELTRPELARPEPAHAEPARPRAEPQPLPPLPPRATPRAAALDAHATPAATAASDAPPPREPARTPPAKPFDLERWLGVRGAAVLGGVFLAIAAFLFLQHSIERGWIGPKTRVIAATIGGLACFAASFPLRRRGYGITASALAGASAVILYAASWAASMLYGFVSPLVAFATMGVVTGTCVYVAWKHGTMLVAVLGLVGGFATPLVLSTGQDRPFALFGYVLLLDLAFLFLSGRRKWPAIGFVALLGTTLIQGVWVALKMDPGEAWIGLSILGVFALLFAGFATTRSSSERSTWMPAQAGAVLLPFGFVVYFAHQIALSIPLGALTLLAALLCAGAGILARRDAMPWLPVGAASGAIALLFTWAASQPTALDTSGAWLLAACTLALVGVLHAFAEWKRADGTRAPGAVAGASTAAMAALPLAAYAALDPGNAHAWPWITWFAALALLLQRQAVLGEHVVLAWIGAGGAAVGLVLQRFAVLDRLQPDRDVAILAGVAALGAALLAAAHVRKSAERNAAFLGVAGYFAIVPCAAWDALARPLHAPSHAITMVAALVFAIGGLAAATGARSGACVLLVALSAWLTQASHVVDVDAVAASSSWTAFVGLMAATTALFAAWPFATRARWRESALGWCVAAFQPVAWAFPIAALVEARLGDTFEFLPPLVFAAGTGAVAFALWRAQAEDGELARIVQRQARIAATLTALLFASAVVPAWMDRQPGVLTLAIFGAATSVLWVRVDSLPVKWISVLSIVAATFGLLFAPGPWEFDVPPRPVANVHAWLYLVPAACAAFAASRLRLLEAKRARAFELSLVGSRQAVGAGITGVAAVVLVFVWINVEIAGLYAIGERAGLDVPHERGRALATSIGWAVYALTLLAIGVVRRASGPRWASLVLFLATIAKVFLFDLGHLAGLQRAASMLGLALSLIVVSLVYQRFVFRRAPAAAEPAT